MGGTPSGRGRSSCEQTTAPPPQSLFPQGLETSNGGPFPQKTQALTSTLALTLTLIWSLSLVRSGPSADQQFSLAPSAPIGLDQKFSSAPLSTTGHGGRGGLATGGGGVGRELLGAADAQTAHPATFSTAPTHQRLGSANAETTPAGAPAAAADRTQRPDATCEGKTG